MRAKFKKKGEKQTYNFGGENNTYPPFESGNYWMEDAKGNKIKLCINKEETNYINLVKSGNWYTSDGYTLNVAWKGIDKKPLNGKYVSTGEIKMKDIKSDTQAAVKSVEKGISSIEKGVSSAAKTAVKSMNQFFRGLF